MKNIFLGASIGLAAFKWVQDSIQENSDDGKKITIFEVITGLTDIANIALTELNADFRVNIEIEQQYQAGKVDFYERLALASIIGLRAYQFTKKAQLPDSDGGEQITQDEFLTGLKSIFDAVMEALKIKTSVNIIPLSHHYDDEF